jgi:hypothetical protein
VCEKRSDNRDGYLHCGYISTFAVSSFPLIFLDSSALCLPHIGYQTSPIYQFTSLKKLQPLCRIALNSHGYPRIPSPYPRKRPANHSTMIHSHRTLDSEKSDPQVIRVLSRFEGDTSTARVTSEEMNAFRPFIARISWLTLRVISVKVLKLSAAC